MRVGFSPASAFGFWPFFISLRKSGLASRPLIRGWIQRVERGLRTPTDLPDSTVAGTQALEEHVVHVDALEPFAGAARLALGLLDRLEHIADWQAYPDNFDEYSRLWTAFTAG